MHPAQGASYDDGSPARSAADDEARIVDSSRDPQAAVVVVACTTEGTIDRGRELLAVARAESDTAVYGRFASDNLAAVYAMRKTGLSLELRSLSVAERYRGQGYGLACLDDALRRAGKRPLVVETDEATLGFYRAAGFKLVGKRRDPGGSARYRLGWHAPTSARPLLPGQGRRITSSGAGAQSLPVPCFEDRDRTDASPPERRR